MQSSATTCRYHIGLGLSSTETGSQHTIKQVDTVLLHFQLSIENDSNIA